MFSFHRAILFILVLVLLQYLVYHSLIKFLKTTKFYKPKLKYWVLIPFILFNVPFLITSAVTRGNFEIVRWLKFLIEDPFYIWQGATLMIALWILAGKIIKLPFQIPIWIMKIFKPLRQKIKILKTREPVKTVDLGRRKFVRYSTMALSAYAFTGAAYGAFKNGAYQIDYKEIKINNLPQEFKGFTITLLSDIHAGQYMDEYDMKEYADAVNSLKSDVICIPGDFVNFDSLDSHHVANAFRDLKAKYGIYGSLGNHDFFQNPDYVSDVLKNESPIFLMRNNHHVINIDGHKLFLLGVDDTRTSGASFNGIILNWLDDIINNISKINPEYQTSPKILLCHKPYGFDEIAQRNIDLTLAGHTHGGQIVPFKMGNINISFAGLVSKYIEGLYTIGKSNMYVSRGIGSVLLPIRINCPPEITKITLV